MLYTNNRGHIESKQMKQKGKKLLNTKENASEDDSDFEQIFDPSINYQ